MSDSSENEMIIISENYRELDIFDDFYLVQQECRESKYYLNSLVTMLQHHVVLPENYDKSIIDQYMKRANVIQEKYSELEKRRGTEENGKIQCGIQDFDIEKHIVNIGIEKLPEIMLKYIKLKNEIDYIQVELLNYLIQVKKDMCEAISKTHDRLDIIFAEYNSQAQMYCALHKSADSDRVDTIAFSCKEKKVLKDLPKDIHQKYKIRNNNYNVEFYRNLLEMWQSFSIDILKQKEEFEQKSLLVDLSKKQYEINVCIVILTITVIILTVVSIVRIS